VLGFGEASLSFHPIPLCARVSGTTNFLVLFLGGRKDETNVRKDWKIQGLCCFSCQTFIQSRSTSLPLYGEGTRFRCDVYFFSWFCRGINWIQYLVHITIHHLHVSFVVPDLQLISSIKTKFTLMAIHSHFTLVLYAKNMMWLFYIKRQRRESIEL